MFTTVSCSLFARDGLAGKVVTFAHRALYSRDPCVFGAIRPARPVGLGRLCARRTEEQRSLRPSQGEPRGGDVEVLNKPAR